MIRKSMVMLLCVFCIIAMVTGCSRDPSVGKPGGEAAAVISIWYCLGDQEEQGLLKQFAKINQEHPEIVIKGEKFSRDGFANEVWTLQAGGEGPEIIIADRQLIIELFNKGVISPVLAQNYSSYSSAKAVFVFNKQFYAAPWLTDVPLLYYRKDKVQMPPASLNELWEKKTALAVSSFDTALLSPWFKAEGGNLSLSGVPALDSAANQAFLNKIFYLKSQGLLLIDNQAVDRFIRGDVNYLLSWASDNDKLSKAGVNWECISLYSILGSTGKVLLDKTIGIANSSIKTNPKLEASIRIVEEALLTPEIEAGMVEAGLPASNTYYEKAAPKSFNAQVDLTLKNAWYLEGYSLNWKLLSLQDAAWRNINGGASAAEELTDIQKSALEIVNKSKS